MVSSNLVGASYKGARWLYAVAGFSLFNCAAWLIGADIRFAALESPDLINSYASWLGTGASPHAALMYKVNALALDALCIALFAGLGYFATKGKTWAYLLGGVLLVADGAGFFLFNDLDPIGILIHAYILYWIFTGWQATIKIHKQVREAKTQTASSSPWTG